MATPSPTPSPRAVRAARSVPARRLTVTTLPSLDPVQAAHLDPFFDTLYAIALRLVAADAAAQPSVAA